jgi:hypothetical protein
MITWTIAFAIAVAEQSAEGKVDLPRIRRLLELPSLPLGVDIGLSLGFPRSPRFMWVDGSDGIDRGRVDPGAEESLRRAVANPGTWRDWLALAKFLETKSLLVLAERSRKPEEERRR